MNNRKMSDLYVLLLSLYLMPIQPSASTWMHIGLLSSVPNRIEDGMQSDQGDRGVCQHLPGLVKQQVNMCDRWPETVESIPFGTKQGLIECEFQFRNDRWNCTDNRSHHTLQSTLERGSKETAFLYAITSAGVVHVVAKACSSGNLTECNCGAFSQKQTPEEWKWGGCSDNVNHGMKFSRRFIDAPDRRIVKKSGDIRNLMNLHNNEAGRRAISRLMLLKCRCHGVSGSCEFKTCWRTMPPFPEIGNYLKRKYDKSAVQVTKALSNISDKDRYRRGASTKKSVKLPVNKKSLVYIQPSPDYCQDDPKAGVVGTVGRECKKKSKGRDSCNFLCCGRGYNTEVVVEYERCKCKFVWCCKVNCKQCRRRKYVHTCK